MSVETGRREGVFDSSSSGLVGYRSLFGVSEAASNGRFLVGAGGGNGTLDWGWPTGFNIPFSLEIWR